MHICITYIQCKDFFYWGLYKPWLVSSLWIPALFQPSMSIKEAKEDSISNYEASCNDNSEDGINLVVQIYLNNISLGYFSMR